MTHTHYYQYKVLYPYSYCMIFHKCKPAYFSKGRSFYTNIQNIENGINPDTDSDWLERLTWQKMPRHKLTSDWLLTSSLLINSTCNFLWISSHSSLYFSDSSLVALIFFLRTSKILDPWTLLDMMDSPCPSIFAANMGLSKMNKMWKFSTFWCLSSLGK